MGLPKAVWLGVVVALVASCGGDRTEGTSTSSTIESEEPDAATTTMATDSTSATGSSTTTGSTTTTSSTASPSGLSFEPCDLLTASEAGGYVGTDVDDGVRQMIDSGDVKDCVWLDPDTFSSVVIQAFANDSVNPDAFNSDEDIGLFAELIDGVGERAMLLTGFTLGGEESEEAVNSIWVLKNGNTIAVYAWNTVTDTPRYQEFFDLVATAVDRMP
jgi:hypothetical protein